MIDLPACTYYELTLKVLPDIQGRRVPRMQLEHPDTKPVVLTCYGDKIEVSALGCVQMAGLADVLACLTWLGEQANELAVSPPPKQGVSRKSTKPKAAKPKPTTPKGPDGKAYPDAVFKGDPPPAVHGGYPEGGGVWDRFKPSAPVDEYGKKLNLGSTD